MDKLISILCELHPDINLETENALIDSGILDSFDIVTIVAEIDDTFGVEIPAEELTPDNFNSVDALFALVQRLRE